MKPKFLFIGMITGAVAGAAAALLNAPMSGKETRKKVKLTQASLKSQAQVIKMETKQIKQSVTHLTAVSKDTIGEVADGLKISAGVWKESTEPNIKKLQRNIVDAQDTVENLQKILPAKKVK